MGTNTYNAVAKYPLIAIPLFILTGMVFERSGVASRLVVFAQAIVGPRRGGLALVAILVCLIMGGMSGSGVADAAAVATVMLPSMLKAGLPQALLGLRHRRLGGDSDPDPALDRAHRLRDPGARRGLCAPSSRRACFRGCSWVRAIAVPTMILSRKHDFGANEGFERPPFWESLYRALPGLMAPVIILGGLRSGLFTPHRDRRGSPRSTG